MASAVIIHGGQGAGKTFLGKIIADMYGKHGKYVNQKILQGDFNEWAENTQFVLADEVIYHGSRRESDMLKNLITQETVTINKKFQPTYSVNDYTNYMLTSNHRDAIHMPGDDRRFLVVESGPKKTPAFYNRVQRWLLKNPEHAYGGIMYYLCNRKIKNITEQYTEPPHTEEKEAMIDESRSSLDQKINDAWAHPTGFFTLGGVYMDKEIWSVDQVYGLLPVEMQKAHTVAAVGKAIGRIVGPVRKQIALPDGRRPRLWSLRNHVKWSKAKPNEWREEFLKTEIQFGNVVSLDSRRTKETPRKKFKKPETED